MRPSYDCSVNLRGAQYTGCSPNTLSPNSGRFDLAASQIGKAGSDISCRTAVPKSNQSIGEF